MSIGLLLSRPHDNMNIETLGELKSFVDVNEIELNSAG